MSSLPGSGHARGGRHSRGDQAFSLPSEGEPGSFLGNPSGPAHRDRPRPPQAGGTRRLWLLPVGVL